MTDYGDLKVSELVEMVNDEYAAIIEADRSNLQRALKVGEMLVDLKPRVAKHGEWQLWLKNHCPKISIETANLYMRLADNIDELEKRAGAKSVRLTDLTITQARELLAKPKPEKGNSSDKGKPTSVVKGAVAEPAIDPPPRPDAPDVALEGLANDEVFHTLQNVYENRRDDLLELTRLLAADLGMTLMPLATTEALMEAIGVPVDADAPAMS